jgi:hypothetical protein
MGVGGTDDVQTGAWVWPMWLKLWCHRLPDMRGLGAVYPLQQGSCG